MTTQRALDEVPASWRDIYPVHPCADVFPMLSDDELDALTEDIMVNGLREPIVIWRAADDSSDRIYILDGRNRMAALVRLGVTFPWPPELQTEFLLDTAFPEGRIETVFRWCHTTDPAAYVIGTNIRRRHLTKQQQAELILHIIEAGRNDDARVARSFSPIAGQRGGSSKDPVLHQAIEAGKNVGVSKRTIQRERAKQRGGTKPRTKKPTDGSAMVVERVAITLEKPSEGVFFARLSHRSGQCINIRSREALMHVVTRLQRVVRQWANEERRHRKVHVERTKAADRDVASPADAIEEGPASPATA